MPKTKAPTKTVQYRGTFTDTFGGEPNFSWVREQTVTVPENSSQRTIMRAVKKAMSLSGVRGTTQNLGDSFTFKPFGACRILFVDFVE